jgi:hypothetical protein
MKGRSFFVVVLLWGWIGVLSVWASQEGREEIFRFSGFYPLLNKRVAFDARTRPSEITVRVEGLRPRDLFIVRSQGEELSIVAGYSSGRLGDLFHRGFDVHPVPESCVRVEGTTVSVRRPQGIEGIVSFDVHVPKEVRVHLIQDGYVRLRARLREPLALREGAVELGTRNRAETVLRAVFGGHLSDVLRPTSPDQPYIVSFQRLTIRKRVPVNISWGEKLYVLLIIEADGRVSHIVPLEPEAIPLEVEHALRQWEFEPFLFDGQAVRVKTLARIR